MNTFSIQNTFEIAWIVIDKPEYVFTKCKRCFNMKTNREIKKTINGGSIGFWVGKEFLTKSQLKTRLIRPIKESCPF